MKFWKLASSAAALVLSTSAHTAIVTHGNLVTDDTTNYIADTVSGRQYLRFDTFDLTYADTVAATSAGGVYADWTIATSQVADDFYASALGLGSTPCSGATSYAISCGVISDWADDDFGVSYFSYEDIFWYISTNITPGREDLPIGLGRITLDGTIQDLDDYTWRHYDIDSYNLSVAPMNALLYRDVSAIPVPAAVWLFGTGLIGLTGLARRKKA